MGCDPTVLSAAAPSWRHWTPLRRCGCRSGNMKMTEHVPSTGRPFRWGQKSPRTVLKPPPRCCRRLLPLSCPGTSASSTTCQPSAFLLTLQKLTLWCVSVSMTASFYTPPPLPCCRTTSPSHSPPKNTCRGPSGCVRGQWLALWILTGHASFISPQ